MSRHLPRTLTFTDQTGKQRRVDEAELANLPKPLVVLGEPGIGKTWLLRNLARRSGYLPVTAAKLIHRPPSTLIVPAGGALLIDGLDELAAVHDSDPVGRVLGKLIEAGCPPFILSCRAAEWSGAIARRDIADDYGVAPCQLWLEPFTRENAVEFLGFSLAPTKAEALIVHLEEKGIAELYGNPLTLDLFAEVARSSEHLPDTRAGLLDRATRLLWREPSDRHHATPLASLDEDAALAAAGLISAVLVLTGAEAISLKPSSAGAEDCVHIPDLRSLPAGEHARAIVGSRLFPPVPDADDRFKPVHRSVAEFLGAAWLAMSVPDDLARERLMAMLTIDGGVPASLRGLHAWLARDARFTAEAIRNDAYGLLRYGDADNLSVAHGRHLLRELTRIEADNPLFRSEDWHARRAKGLCHLELIEDIKAILLDGNDHWQLRTLILNAIAGSELASALREDLEAIVLGHHAGSLNYAERHDAALALLRLDRSDIDWPAIVKRLIAQRGEDATRLALDIMQDRHFSGMSAEMVVDALLVRHDLDAQAEAGDLDLSSAGSLYFVEKSLPDELIASVLDRLATHLPERKSDVDPKLPFEISSLITSLVARRIATEPPEPPTLLRWLRMTRDRHGEADDDRKRILDYLSANSTVRRSIQRRILLDEPARELPGHALWLTRDVSPGLAMTADDIIDLLNNLADIEAPTDRQIATWQELVAASRGIADRAQDIITTARPFADARPELQEFLAEVEKPLAPQPWEIERDRRNQERNRKRETEWAGHREHFALHLAELRRGELRYTYPVAQAYLGQFSDINKDIPPHERLRLWLGDDLLQSALAGLDATLTRSDLPSPDQIAESYAEQRRWHFILPMIAAVAEHVRSGASAHPLPTDLRISVLIGLHNESLAARINANELVSTIEDSLRLTPADHERYFRLLIEPFLARACDSIRGLYAFVHSAADRPLASRLTLEWLERFDGLPYQTELELIDGADYLGQSASMAALAKGRLDRQVQSADRCRAWQAVAFKTDFDAFVAEFGAVTSTSADLIWALRHRLGEGRCRTYDPAAAAPR